MRVRRKRHRTSKSKILWKQMARELPGKRCPGFAGYEKPIIGQASYQGTDAGGEERQAGSSKPLIESGERTVKKDPLCGKGAERQLTLSPDQKYILIRSVIQRYQLERMVNNLCKMAGVSRSGYYRYWSAGSEEKRKHRDQKDEQVKEIILKAFHFKRRKKGARSIKMTLEGQFKVVYNLKRIRRIMKKYGIVCPFRKANPYKRMMKATQEHRVVPNLLNREFKQ
ncbi:IS3 family transposase, partial [Paenibacillus validus]|nr:IS3 family transposase [Paenibacillus validus]